MIIAERNSAEHISTMMLVNIEPCFKQGLVGK